MTTLMSFGNYQLPGLGDVGASFSQSVEDWRDLITSNAGDLPVNFLMAWVSKESAGNPCSYTRLHESGIFQLMVGSNQDVAGTNESEMHPVPPCTPGVQTTAYFSSLTTDQQDLQVQKGIAYVQWARQKAHDYLDAAGVDWSENGDGSFWQMTKLVFNYPGYIPGWLANATSQLGHTPANWDEFRSTINGYSDILNNAEYVGAFGAGGGNSSLVTTITSGKNLLIFAFIAAAIFGAWAFNKKVLTKYIGHEV